MKRQSGVRQGKMTSRAPAQQQQQFLCCCLAERDVNLSQTGPGSIPSSSQKIIIPSAAAEIRVSTFCESRNLYTISSSTQAMTLQIL